MGNSKDKRKGGRTLLKICAWGIGIWLVILIALQAVLSPAILTGLVNRAAGDYIDGELHFGRASASVITNFPNLNVTLEDVSLTYPPDRFTSFYGNVPDGRLLRSGHSPDADTLASFKRFSTSIDLASLIAGHIRIPSLELSKPRIFAKHYSENDANWNIFKASSEGPDSNEEEDRSGSGPLPRITVEKIVFDQKPFIVYCSPKDTLFTALHLNGLDFKGRLSTRKTHRNRISFTADTLVVAGRMASDTISLKLDRFRIRQHRNHIDLSLLASTTIATRTTGRMTLPVKADAHINFPKDSVPAVSVRDFTAEIAGIPIKANADIRYMTGSLWLKGDASVNRCRIKNVLNYCGKGIWSGADALDTDAVVVMNAIFEGYYDFSGDRLPSIDMTARIPDSSIEYDGIGTGSKIGADIRAKGDGIRYNIDVNDLYLKGKSVDLSVKGSAYDILGKDPLFDVNGKVSMLLDTLQKFISPEKEIFASGVLEAEAKGNIRQSQMNPYKFADSDLRGFVKSDRLYLSSEKDSVNVHIDSLDIVLATVGNTRDSSITQGTRMIALVAKVDSTAINYKNIFDIRGRRLALKAQNDAAILNDMDSSSFYPFGGKLEIGRLSVTDSDSSRIYINRSDNVFKVSPSAKDKNVPVLRFTSENRGIRLISYGSRFSLNNLKLNASATKNTMDRKHLAKAFVDSVAKKYPDIPKDSLFSHLRKIRGAGTIPEWLTEKDFRKNDIDFKLDDAFAKYYKEWSFDGNMSFRRANVMTPYFPLRTSVKDFSGHITNNTVSLDRLTLTSGRSHIAATGKLSGIRGALLRNGPISLNLKVTSDSLNVNELLSALSIGSGYSSKPGNSNDPEMDDEEYLAAVVIDTLGNAVPESSLFVIPSNVKANIVLEASNATYSKLDMDWIAAELTMKERCIQIKNTVASTNMGDLYFEGFYSTRTKKNLKTGFNINLVDITADKVIDMMPAVDSIMPMLKSFKGMLDCELAATASIDTTMSILMPTLTGVIRISGKDLALQESESLFKIARMLKFKDIHNININDMSVEGVISDNRIEIFPFLLSVDRYSLAMSGIQNLDQTFKYHISALKSPLLVRFGVDLWGDFDNFRFKIGKAKYKNANIPVFSAVVDQTKLNLSQSIRNIFSRGVEQAIRENESQKLINAHKEDINYENPADTGIEELSEDEAKQLEEDNNEQEQQLNQNI